MSNQNNKSYFNQNSNGQSTNQQDYSEKSYLQSLMGSQKLSQSKSIAKRTKKIDENEVERTIEQSRVMKHYLDEEQNLFEEQEQQFYCCNYCDSDFQGRYDVDRHEKLVHPEEYCQDNPDFFQCEICFYAFHKSNCKKHIKNCVNKKRERLRQKKYESQKIGKQNQSLGDFQSYQQILDNRKIMIELQNEINSLQQSNANKELSLQQKQIELMKKQLEELKIQKNSQTQAATCDTLNSSFISDLTKNFNQTINHALTFQSTAVKGSDEQDMDEEDDKKSIHSAKF
ncbi:hypothetical protein ABPG74_003758 [Tetrahymena malaccensis]